MLEQSRILRKLLRKQDAERITPVAKQHLTKTAGQSILWVAFSGHLFLPLNKYAWILCNLSPSVLYKFVYISKNKSENCNLFYTCFPALGTGCTFSRVGSSCPFSRALCCLYIFPRLAPVACFCLRVVIGPLRYLCLFWFDRWSTFVWIYDSPFRNHSM